MIIALGGSGGVLSKHLHLRAVGAGCGVLEYDEPEKRYARLSSKAPGTQTAPRTEIWAQYRALVRWKGDHPLIILTDASYTISGTMPKNRMKCGRGKNGDIWSLIYSEVDAKDHTPSMQKVKSHSTVPQILSSASPDWHSRLNELADLAALEASDHQGVCEVDCRAQEAKEAKLQQVCPRLSYSEMTLRGKAISPPLVVADIVRAVELEGTKWRLLGKGKVDAEISIQGSTSNHQADWIEGKNGRGVWRCMKCGVRANGNSGSGGWAKRNCNNNDSLAHTVALAKAAYRRPLPSQGSDGRTDIAGWSDHFRPTGI